MQAGPGKSRFARLTKASQQQAVSSDDHGRRRGVRNPHIGVEPSY